MAGCSSTVDEPLFSPDGSYEAAFVSIENDQARTRIVTIKSASGKVLFDSTDALTVRDRDYVFGFWNSDQELVVYTSDTGTYEISTSDGISFDLAALQGECITLGPDVDLSADELGRIKQC